MLLPFAIRRLCALLKPAKEALRPTAPTAAVSLGDRNRTLTDMAVTVGQIRTCGPRCVVLPAVSLLLSRQTGVSSHARSPARAGEKPTPRRCPSFLLVQGTVLCRVLIVQPQLLSPPCQGAGSR